MTDTATCTRYENFFGVHFAEWGRVGRGSGERVGELFPRSLALPGNADPEALPPILSDSKRGRASGHRFPGRARERVVK